MLRDMISECIVNDLQVISLRQKNEVGELIIGFDLFIIMSLFLLEHTIQYSSLVKFQESLKYHLPTFMRQDRND
jgi:hypothetical protein